MPFGVSTLFCANLPAPAKAPVKAFPAFDFIGGHHAAARIPVEALTAATTNLIAREGATLATYGLSSGP